MTLNRPARGFAHRWLDWLVTLVLNIALPIVTYNVLADNGMATVPALALSSAWPLVELGLTWLRRGHVDEFSVFVLIAIVLGVGTSLLFDDPHLALAKESIVTGLFGLVLIGSTLAMERPLMFYFARKFATDGSRVQVRWWHDLWRFAGFRRAQYVITVMWGVALLAEAVARVLLSFLLPVSTMVTINNIAPTVVIGLLVLATSLYNRHARASVLRTDPDALTPPTAREAAPVEQPAVAGA